MVAAAADAHCLLLEHSQARSGLAGVEHLGLQSLETGLIAGGLSGDAAHALHDVEHDALCLQQRAHGALDLEGHVAGLDMGAVLDIDGHLELGIELLEHPAGHLDTCEHALLLDDEALHAALVGRNGAESGVVAVAHVLGKRQSEQIVYELVFSFHYTLY